MVVVAVCLFIWLEPQRLYVTRAIYDELTEQSKCCYVILLCMEKMLLHKNGFRCQKLPFSLCSEATIAMRA